MAFGYPVGLVVDAAFLPDLQGVDFAEDAFTGLAAPLIRRGENGVVPRKRGKRGAKKVLDAFTFSVPFLVTCTDDDGERPGTPALRGIQTALNYHALITTVAGLANGGLVDIARRLRTAPGVTVDQTAAGEFLGVQQLEWDVEEIQGVLNFNNLDGAWLDGTDWIVP